MFKKEVVESVSNRRPVVRFRDMKLDETTWRRAQHVMARGERRRLISIGHIKPTGPSMLTKNDDGSWTASA